ncbi:MAG: hypothetical protein BWX66_01848 [Deltaproteobacteria bacterium ADurb.Bin058]|nr:MAG: hypothetical protein BWX66_01848 [Deltaproteobacteria bacterium ADurb.Bin058]
MSIKSNKFLRFFGTILAILVLVELGARAGTWVFFKISRTTGCAPFGELCEFASIYGPIDTPLSLTHNPYLGLDVKPNYKDFDAKRRLASTDSHGFRSKYERSKTKDPSRLRILAVGDSFTFGFGANDDETFPAYLETIYEDVEAINAGVLSFGLDQIYLKAGMLTKEFSPDVLLVGLITHDLVRITTRHYAGRKPVFKKIDGEWKLTGTPVPTRKERLKRQLPLIIAFPKLQIDILLRPSKSETDETIAELSEWLVLQIVREAQELNIRPVFVLMPQRLELAPTESMGIIGKKQYELLHQKYELLLQIYNQHQLEYVDLFPEFFELLETHGWQDFETKYLADLHFSSKGYEIVAKAVGEYLNLTPVSTQ